MLIAGRESMFLGDYRAVLITDDVRKSFPGDYRVRLISGDVTRREIDRRNGNAVLHVGSNEGAASMFVGLQFLQFF